MFINFEYFSRPTAWLKALRLLTVGIKIRKIKSFALKLYIFLVKKGQFFPAPRLFKALRLCICLPNFPGPALCLFS